MSGKVDVVNFASTTAGQSMSAPLICRDAILKNVFCLTVSLLYNITELVDQMATDI